MKQQHTFKRLPIHKQFLIMSTVSLFVIIALAIMTFNSMQDILITNANDYAALSTQRCSNELDVLCLKLDVLCSQLQSEEIYKTLLSADSYSALPAELVGDVSSSISYIKNLNTDIADVAFSNDLIHWSSLYSEQDLAVMYELAADSELSANHGIGFRKSSFLPFSDKIYYVYCSNIYQNGKRIGCAFISLDMEKLSFNLTDFMSPASFYIMDVTGNLFSLDDAHTSIPDEVTAICETQLSHHNNPDFQQLTTMYQYPFSIQLVYSGTAQCYVISAVHIPSISKTLDATWNRVWILVIAFAVFAFLLLTTLYTSMITPLNQFSSIINKMGTDRQRHLGKPLTIDGCEEVRNLADTFSKMFSTIDALNMQIFEASAKLYEEKIRGQATEISFFRSQINPHFLYNVLELIRSQALTHNVPEIASIAIAMGKMYRYNTKGAPVVAFLEELEMTKAYIEIQKLRFQDKFDIIYHIPDEVLSIPVIKIILQPLVENSIQHGIEPALTKCTLYIGCTLTKDTFCIEIRDDGVGMPPEKLMEMQEMLEKKNYDASNYVGITNTNARLKLQYGDPYGITIDSHENDGTVVTITMPLPKGEEMC